MKQKVVIQKALAVFFTLVFAISIAPKAWFHDLVADHKDYSDCRQLHHSKVLHQQAYNCHFDDLVVSTPFVSTSAQVTFFTKTSLEKKQAVFYSPFLQSFSQHKESRGPPAI